MKEERYATEEVIPRLRGGFLSPPRRSSETLGMALATV
jgi:hypothetical protein